MHTVLCCHLQFMPRVSSAITLCPSYTPSCWQVDVKTMCHQTCHHGGGELRYPTKVVLDKFIANTHIDSDVLHQYFLAENGLHTIFPAFEPKASYCPHTCHRLKYVHTDGRTDGRADGRTDRQTDIVTGKYIEINLSWLAVKQCQSITIQ